MSVLGDVVAKIPMPALVGVMVMVSISTFDWKSILNLRSTPRSDAVVMLTTVTIVVLTGNLALGVLAGIVISALVFGWKMAQLHIETITKDGKKVYVVTGQLFFASTAQFVQSFNYREDPAGVVIDLSGSHVWDHSGVTAIMKVARALLLERCGCGLPAKPRAV